MIKYIHEGQRFGFLTGIEMHLYNQMSKGEGGREEGRVRPELQGSPGTRQPL